MNSWHFWLGFLGFGIVLLLVDPIIFLDFGIGVLLGLLILGIRLLLGD